jgi:hypothetical protein
MTVKFNLKFSYLIFGLAMAAGSIKIARADFGNVNVFPNPYKTSLGHTQIQFNNLPASTRIQIYDINGNLVREQHLSPAATSFTWDLKNDSGENIASGVYLYVLTDENNNKRKGKLAVIR